MLNKKYFKRRKEYFFKRRESVLVGRVFSL